MRLSERIKQIEDAQAKLHVMKITAEECCDVWHAATKEKQTLTLAFYQQTVRHIALAKNDLTYRLFAAIFNPIDAQCMIKQSTQTGSADEPSGVIKHSLLGDILQKVRSSEPSGRDEYLACARELADCMSQQALRQLLTDGKSQLLVDAVMIGDAALVGRLLDALRPTFAEQFFGDAVRRDVFNTLFLAMDEAQQNGHVFPTDLRLQLAEGAPYGQFPPASAGYHSFVDELLDKYMSTDKPHGHPALAIYRFLHLSPKVNRQELAMRDNYHRLKQAVKNGNTGIVALLLNAVPKPSLYQELIGINPKDAAHQAIRHMLDDISSPDDYITEDMQQLLQSEAPICFAGISCVKPKKAQATRGSTQTALHALGGRGEAATRSVDAAVEQTPNAATQAEPSGPAHESAIAEQEASPSCSPAPR